MNYITDKKLTVVHSYELAAYHMYNRFPELRGVANYGSLRDAVRPITGLSFSYPFTYRSMSFELRGSVDSYSDGLMRIRMTLPYQSEDHYTTLFARAHAFIAAYAFMKQTLRREVDVLISFEGRSGGELRLPVESINVIAAEKFFTAAIARVASPRDISVELEDRESYRRLKFPYPKMRDAQREFISRCYDAIKKGKRIYVSAPTGVGKTVSALFPAVRGLGMGVIDKIFYLTPRGITNDSAAEAIELLNRGGGHLRGIEIVSKERCCSNGFGCKSPEGCKLKRRGRSDYVAAALEIFSGSKRSVIRPRDLSVEAERRGLCSHELALTYSELCDIIICDYNYLFDPASAFIRYFSKPGGRWCFLIDEAHNLPERAREIYSGKFNPRLLTDLSQELRALLQHFDRKKADMAEKVICSAEQLYTAISNVAIKLTSPNSSLSAEGKLCGSYRSSEPISALKEDLSAVSDRIRGVFLDDKDNRSKLNKEQMFIINQQLSEIAAFGERLQRFDSDFDFFIFREGDELQFVSYCIDPARLISERLDLGCSAVFFSGTLYPPEFFSRILGARQGDPVCQFDSPYESDQLAIVAYDGISTKYSEREETLGEIARVIYSAISAKRGNYLVFAPSYEYLHRIHSEFVGLTGDRVLTVVQKQHMNRQQREDFVSKFTVESTKTTVGFCVLGGLFSESLNLTGESLIGSIIVGVALPRPSCFTQSVAEYFDKKYEEGFEFAYLYPSAEKIFQAGGRVIRSETDKGILVLIDSRYDDPRYQKLFPDHWQGLKFTSDRHSLESYLKKFWSEN